MHLEAWLSKVAPCMGRFIYFYFFEGGEWGGEDTIVPLTLSIFQSGTVYTNTYLYASSYTSSIVHSGFCMMWQ